MPVRFAFMSALLFLVPVFGLSSCSKDKPDDWSMPEPTVIGTDLSLKVSASGDRTLPPDSRLTFTGAPWTTLDVQSDCRMADRRASDTFTFSYRESVSIKSLWPSDFVKSLSAADLESSECDFHFLATNDKGSTQEFALTKARLSKFTNATAALKIWQREGGILNALDLRSSALPLSLPADRALLQSVTQDLLTEIGGRGSISFICNDQRSDQAVHDSSEIDVNSLVSKLNLVEVKSCHFLASSRQDANEFSLSREFEFSFSKPVLRISTKFNMFNQAGHRDGFSISIENAGQTVARFSLPKKTPALTFHIVGHEDPMASRLFQMIGFVVSQRELSWPTTLAVRNAILEQDDGATLSYSLSPGQVTTIDLQIDPLRICYPGGMGLTDPIVGLYYGFSSAFEIHQLEDGASVYSAPVWTTVYTPAASAVSEDMQAQYGSFIPTSAQMAPQLVRSHPCF